MVASWGATSTPTEAGLLQRLMGRDQSGSTRTPDSVAVAAVRSAGDEGCLTAQKKLLRYLRAVGAVSITNSLAQRIAPDAGVLRRASA